MTPARWPEWTTPQPFSPGAGRRSRAPTRSHWPTGAVRTRTPAWWTCETGVVRTVATRRLPRRDIGRRRDGRRLLARRGPRGRRHLVLAAICEPGRTLAPTRAARPRLPRGGHRSRRGRALRRGRLRGLPAHGRRPRRAALGRVELDADGGPGRLRSLAAPGRRRPGVVRDPRPAARPRCWSGMSTAPARSRSGISATGTGHPIGIGIDRVLPGWSVHARRPQRGAGAVRADSAAQPLPRRPGRRRSGCGTGSATPAASHRRAARPRAADEAARQPVAAAVSGRRRNRRCTACCFAPPGRTGPLPTVLLLHGGPESQERPAFSILVQSLTVAGFAVVAPNVRGSSGYGVAFMRDGRRRAARVVLRRHPGHACDYLVASGVSEPGRIGVHGWSYGGYLALVALTRWPRMFACRIQPCRNVRPQRILRRDGALDGRRVGHRVRRSGAPTRLCCTTSRRCTGSPRRAHRPCWCTASRTPTCRSPSRCAAHEALRAAGVPTELLLLPGEGHTIVGHEGRIASTLADRRLARPVDRRDQRGHGPAAGSWTDTRRGRSTRRSIRTAASGPRTAEIIAALDDLGIDGLRDGRAALDRSASGRASRSSPRSTAKLQEQPFPLDPVPRVVSVAGLGAHRGRAAAADAGAERLPRRRLRRAADRARRR